MRKLNVQPPLESNGNLFLEQLTRLLIRQAQSQTKSPEVPTIESHLPQPNISYVWGKTEKQNITIPLPNNVYWNSTILLFPS